MYEKEHKVRLVRPNDINALTSMDLKCYHYPMEMPEWKEKINGSGKDDHARIVVVEFMRKAVGYAMWTVDLEHVGVVHRLGVLPECRNRGIGTLLVAACNRHCYESKCDVLKLIVPALHCKAGDPDDVSVFLQRTDFKATGEILYEYREMYGDPVDGYVFERRTADALTIGVREQD